MIIIAIAILVPYLFDRVRVTMKQYIDSFSNKVIVNT